MPTPAEWSVIARYSSPAPAPPRPSSSERRLAVASRRCAGAGRRACRRPRRAPAARVPARAAELAVVLAQLGRDRLVAEVAVDLVLVARAEDLAGLDRLDAPLGHLQAALLPRPRACATLWRLRAGEVLQEVAVALGRHDAQVDLHAVVRDRRSPSCRRGRRPRRRTAARTSQPISARGSSEAAIRSMSPTVSTRRRSEPGLVGAHAGGVRAQAARGRLATSSSARSSRMTLLRGAAPGGELLEQRCSFVSAECPPGPRSVPSRAAASQLRRAS